MKRFLFLVGLSACVLTTSATAQPTISLTEYERLCKRLAAVEQELAETKEAISVQRLPATTPQPANFPTPQPVAPPPPPPPPPPAPASDPRVDALQEMVERLQSDAKLIKYPNFTVNGVFQADAGWYTQDEVSRESVGDLQDGADFRRARLSAQGALTPNFNYFFQMDFAFFGRPTFTDVWVECTNLPYLGTVRAGQWKQPYSLEVVSSFRYTTFMERSLLFIPFTPFRHIGVGFYNHNDELTATWAASVFRTGNDHFGGDIGDNGGVSMAARGTLLPYYDEPSGGRYYTHLGAGYFLADPDNDVSRYATIPEFFVGEVAPGIVGTSDVPVPGAQNGTPFFVDTGNIPTNISNRFGTEFLAVYGPLSIQSEAMCAVVDRLDGGTVFFPGVYAQVGWFLTGEHRPYNRTLGCIDRVKPFEDFFRVMTDRGICTGSGAWEVATRVSWIDLNDDDIRGGELTDVTFGVNWYMNAYAKMQFNYIHAFLDNPTFGDSDTGIYGARVQMDF
jgi:phosphate-selective porin OprO/OprP